MTWLDLLDRVMAALLLVCIAYVLLVIAPQFVALLIRDGVLAR